VADATRARVHRTADTTGRGGRGRRRRHRTAAAGAGQLRGM